MLYLVSPTSLKALKTVSYRRGKISEKWCHFFLCKLSQPHLKCLNRTCRKKNGILWWRLYVLSQWEKCELPFHPLSISPANTKESRLLSFFRNTTANGYHYQWQQPNDFQADHPFRWHLTPFLQSWKLGALFI